MSKLTDAALTLERQALKYESLMNAAAELRKLGAIEDAANELQVKAEANRQELAQVTADLNEAHNAAEQFQETMEAKQKEAGTIYVTTIANANEQAGNTIAQANADAQTIKDRATHDADRLRADAQVFVNSLAVQKSELQADIERLSGLKDQAQSEADAAEARLADIKGQIASLAKAG